MKIERIKKSLSACGVFHVRLVTEEVYCEWYSDNGLLCVDFYDSYGTAYRKLKKIGVLTKERYLLHRYG